MSDRPPLLGRVLEMLRRAREAREWMLTMPPEVVREMRPGQSETLDETLAEAIALLERLATKLRRCEVPLGEQP